MSDQPERYRPTTRLTIPLQTGDGFAMAVFMWGIAWMPALVVAIAGLLLLLAGHWVLGPICTLVGAFFLAAFRDFPRNAWVARPCDIELDAAGFRVVGGYHRGVRLTWDELDAEACKVRDGAALFSRRLIAATRSGTTLTVAEGEEDESFAAVLDAWRASAGLAPLEGQKPDERTLVRRAGQLPLPPSAARTAREQRQREIAARPKAPPVSIVRCGRCGIAACPSDQPTTPCLHCGEPVAMPEDLRRRLRDGLTHAAVKAKSQSLLSRALAQPRAPLTLALMGVLGAAMVAAWCFAFVVFARSLLQHTLDITLVVVALLAPLLVTLTLSTLASVLAVQRVAVRAVVVDFAAIAPSAPGRPCSCRVCGAPLPLADRDVIACAYCTSISVVSTARPRAPSHMQEQATLLAETLEAQRYEHKARWMLVAVVGVPALWGAVSSLRWLWARLA